MNNLIYDTDKCHETTLQMVIWQSMTKGRELP